MVSTGLEELDHLLSGGYPDKSGILVEGPAGVGKEALGYRFISSGIPSGDFCLYVTRLGMSEVLHDTRAFGVDLLKGAFWLAGRETQIKCDVNDLQGLSVNVKDIIRKNTGRRIRVVTDVLSSLLVLNPPDTIYRFLSQLLTEVKQHDAVFLATIEEGMHQPQVLAAMEQLFDGVMQLRLYEEGLGIMPLLRVRKMRGIPPQPSYFRFSSRKEKWRSLPMPSSPIPFSALVMGSLIIALFAYGAYWAFQVRSVLVTRRYRDRALWVGASATFLALLVLSDILIGSLSPDNWYLSFLQFGIGYLDAALTFAWVDSTLRVSRTSDPLQRNTFHWAGLRIFGWIVLTISIIGGLVSVALRNTNYFTTPTGPQGAFLSGPFANLAIVCFPALILSRRRVGDVVLQRHLRWLASFVIVLFFTVSLLNNSGSSIPRMIGGLLLIVDAFCVYMAAKSLAPLSHIAPEEVPSPRMSIEGNVNPV